VPVSERAAEVVQGKFPNGMCRGQLVLPGMLLVYIGQQFPKKKMDRARRALVETS
jgi:hypothetical protein